MLVLSLKTDEWLRITNEDGSEIDVVVVRIRDDKVRIGIEADATKRVLRGELIERGERTNGIENE
jgi:carbon storage regulator CsrA